MQRKLRREWQRTIAQFVLSRSIVNAPKQRRARRRWRRAMIKILLPQIAATGILLSTYGLCLAEPNGGQVTAGQGAIGSDGNTTTITQNSDKMVIDWQSFNIGFGETVQFIQPGKNAIALNRILGNSASSIYGSLLANGKIFLINPNGILFGSTAQIDVGGLVASTLNLSDSDFLAGNYTFDANGAYGSVVNRGEILAADGGYVVLVGAQVRNDGVLAAENGTVALAAGDRVTLDFNGDGLLGLAVDRGTLSALVENQSLVEADGGKVIMTARAADDLAGTVVNNSGVVRAQSINQVDGVIILDGGVNGTTLNSGTLDASGKDAGEPGGTVKMLGENVGLTGGSLIDVSGNQGGGTVLVGGNFQGKGPEQNATATYIGANAVIDADALSNGNGGRVAVWGDEATRFYGTIVAQGGSLSGNGGMVETSGAYLEAAGKVDAGANNGSAGSWLLDPDSITIQDSGSDTNVGSSPNFISSATNAVLTTG
ncbi:MAG TPA: filamentous hemagglutinin N-terminal domain-containing protein, partial [Bacillota bacterium]|nr:filamentous hemagglutinin N-terminal domain-containing protein [Bacillota bacterium]